MRVGTPVAVHQSMTNPILLGGVPRTIAILNWIMAFAFSLPSRSYYVFFIFLGLHYVLAKLHKDDDQYVFCMIRYFFVCNFKRYYRR